jgi:dihydroorotate dehydrogenase (NAD+) catalytic subunit
VIADWGAGLINAVGLSNPGVEATAAEIRAAKRSLKPKGIAIIASIFAESVWDFGLVAESISDGEPDLIEVNISCPNVENEFGQFFCATPYVAAQVTRRVKQCTHIPIVVKVSPNEAHIADIARAVVDAGADAVSAINTLGPGMVLDIESRAPVISNRVGGISGPAIHPIAVRCVYDIAHAVAVPIIGGGGNATARDCIEMILAGAHAVSIGSAVYSHGLGVFEQVTGGIADYMRRHHFARLEEFRSRVRDTKPVVGVKPAAD